MAVVSAHRVGGPTPEPTPTPLGGGQGQEQEEQQGGVLHVWDPRLGVKYWHRQRRRVQNQGSLRWVGGEMNGFGVVVVGINGDVMGS